MSSVKTLCSVNEKMQKSNLKTHLRSIDPLTVIAWEIGPLWVTLDQISIKLAHFGLNWTKFGTDIYRQKTNIVIRKRDSSVFPRKANIKLSSSLFIA